MLTMCLWIKQGQKPFIAKEPIKVYKILREDDTPVHMTDFKYCPGEIHTSELIVHEEKQVEEGLHTFVNAWEAYDMLEPEVEKLVEMIIPAGATVYYGLAYWGEESLASDKLYYPKDITEVFQILTYKDIN